MMLLNKALDKTMKTTTLSYDRYDWYQTDSRVVITILVKNRTSDDVKCEIQDDSVSYFIVFSSSRTVSFRP